MARAPAERLRDLGVVVESVARAIDDDRAEPEHFDRLIAGLRGLRRELFGATRQPGSARARLRAYLIDHVGQTVYGEELSEISGILAWARRVRELRAEGLDIVELGGGRYRLERLSDDAHSREL